MLAKTGKLWWLVIVLAFLAGACAYPLVAGLGSIRFDRTPMYVGRTTLMESGQRGNYERQMAELGNVATSQAVLSNAAQTLLGLGVKSTPQEVLTHTTVTPVRDTNILAIEVTLPDAMEAKVATDVIAAETKKEYARRYGKPDDGASGLRTIDPAFVHQLERGNPARLVLALLFTPLAGPIIGVIVGLVFGLALAALIRKRRADCPSS